jgi:class 3 adenylate cyclase
MSSLPLGAITFVFTDIEGSTRLVQQLGENYGALLARQPQISRKTIAAHGGQVLLSQTTYDLVEGELAPGRQPAGCGRAPPQKIAPRPLTVSARHRTIGRIARHP